MEHTTVVGIDVSKERLDVHVLPSEEAWAVSRDADGLAELCRRLAGLSGVVAVEATGGYETIVAASAAHSKLRGRRFMCRRTRGAGKKCVELGSTEYL